MLPETSVQPAATHNSEERYSRLTRADIAKLLRLHDEGLTQAQIAGILQVNQSTVCRTIAAFEDTADLAVRRLKARALTAADAAVTIMETATPKVALAAAKTVLDGAGVTGQRVTGINVGVKVVYGTESTPAIDAGAISVQVGESR